MTAAKVKIIFHIGQHKTGSKALQSFLYLHSAALAQRGILYPVDQTVHQKVRAYQISHYRLFALLRHEALQACGQANAARHYWREQRAICRPYDCSRAMFDAIENERRRIGADTIIVSAEDLFDMQTAHQIDLNMDCLAAGVKILSELARAFQYQPVVVTYVRRQDHLLGAHYVQYVKGSRDPTIEFKTFARTFAPRLDTYRLLACWSTEFGADAMVVRPYERAAMPTGIVADFFECALQQAIPSDWMAPAPEREAVNTTPGRDQVELIRHLHRRRGSGWPLLRRAQILDTTTALNWGVTTKHGSTIAAWLSPAQRRQLLLDHTEGNARIAQHYLPKTKTPLFSEPPPHDDASWQPYSGLSAQDTAAIIRQVRRQLFCGGSIKWIAAGALFFLSVAILMGILV
ncbi:hypothetical protein [Candidatus Nitrotoga sp. HW29]|uniref:hypothetical protein n=1 Tax=Candidatus Nitrotoga sp. HW29 TaxID=2886963 RepID=UPI001EF2FB6C|nr:hypothetical protein [Candidatus Nitrotoga sp. HW29]